jgi:hypothetical protein
VAYRIRTLPASKPGSTEIKPYQAAISPAAIFRDSDFFELFPSLPGKVEKSNINKKTATVVVHPPTPLTTISYKEFWKSLIPDFATDPYLSCPFNSSVSSDGDTGSFRLGAADRRPIFYEPAHRSLVT